MNTSERLALASYSPAVTELSPTSLSAIVRAIITNNREVTSDGGKGTNYGIQPASLAFPLLEDYGAKPSVAALPLLVTGK